jgi:hypothetical protein
MPAKEYLPITLRAKEPYKAKAMDGNVDNRRFNRSNKLYAFRLKSNNLWKLRLQNGFVPQYLRYQLSTSTNSMMKVVKSYYATRNVVATLA